MFKTTILAGLLVLVSLVSSWAADTGTVLEGQKMPSRILGKDVEHTVYLPPKYDDGNRSYPVVYLTTKAIGFLTSGSCVSVQTGCRNRQTP
ncbi:MULTISPECIES: hypothetical protein [unclassified Ensifer]|uniref:hypothetical protein n=1 Tax=unclassified Ensifer TaxID=2633371 RepID=UPI0008133305|nr:MULTISPECIES: hypothetical protein [unclassified Ensifer]OCP16096.1 hypothetical protein BC363_11830 [Ensifer sp. LC384]OCP20165.1 hypothetical protein BC361_05085 [Ensifer sp. LC54]